MRGFVAAALALGLCGCIALARESYSTLGATGATPIPPADRVPISRESAGHGFGQDPTALRAGSDVVLSVCDWDPGFWMVVFPPLPIPFFSSAEDTGLPGTTLVRITFERKGPWKARFNDLALVGSDGKRHTPIRYRVVLPERAESLAGRETPLRDMEPCGRSVEPHKTVKRAHVAVLGPGELLLTFDSADLPEKGRRLELNGLTRNDVAVPIPPVTLDGGSRWYWYEFFP